MNTRPSDLARKPSAVAAALPYACKLEKIRSVLAALPPKEREVLYRFYVLGHESLQIDQELLFEGKQLASLRAHLRGSLLTRAPLQ